MDKSPMTLKGHEALKEELKRLKTIERPAIIQAIEEARAHGDLSENAEYHAAKEKQGFNEGRIADLEGKLASAEVIDPTKLSGERVVFGATVKLLNLDTDEEVTYQIVGPDEADVSKGMISMTSPVARGLLGKSEGDDVNIRTPKGASEYEILKVQFI